MSFASELIARQLADAALNKSVLGNTLLTAIQGTTQFVVFNSNGTVQKVQHKDDVGAIVREDVFTFEPNLITEVRTLTLGGSITFKTHLDTFQTEVY